MSDNYDRIIFPDKSYDLIAPKKKFIETMKSYFPDNANEIDGYIKLVTMLVKAP